MRINGFNQIKAFYSWCFDNQDKNIKPQHISLYLFLLNQNNRANWVEWFKCPYDLAMTGSCIGSKKTYYNCLIDLQDWKLIEYQKGVNDWKAPLIKVEVLKDTSSVPQSEPQGVPQHTPQGILLPIPQGTKRYKLITDNLKLVTDKIEGWINFEINKEDSIPPKGETFDFSKLLEFINLKTGRKYQVINDNVKNKFKARLKEGYSKECITNAIINASKTPYHMDNSKQYLTPEFFSRSSTLDKYGIDVSTSSQHTKPVSEMSNEEKYMHNVYRQMRPEDRPVGWVMPEGL